MTDRALGRPLIGQERLLSGLRQWRQSGSTQVLALSGPAGSGRRTLARRVAASLLCQRPSQDTMAPCGECPSCRWFEAGTHPDFISLAAPDAGKMIPISEVRSRVIADVPLRPQLGARKVYLLDGDALAEGSQNALLKTLEEPPPYAYLLLTVRRAANLLPTVLSRLTLLQMDPLSDSELEQMLREEGVEDDDLVAAAVRQAAGLPGQALAFALDETRQAVSLAVEQFFAARLEWDQAEHLTAGIDSFQEQRQYSILWLNEAEIWLRDLLYCVNEETQGRQVNPDRLRRPSHRDLLQRYNRLHLKPDEVSRAAAAVAAARESLSPTVNGNFELAAARLLLVLDKELSKHA